MDAAVEQNSADLQTLPFSICISLQEHSLYEKENSLHHCLLPVCDFPDKSGTQFCLCSNAAELWYLLW